MRQVPCSSSKVLPQAFIHHRFVFCSPSSEYYYSLRVLLIHSFVRFFGHFYRADLTWPGDSNENRDEVYGLWWSRILKEAAGRLGRLVESATTTKTRDIYIYKYKDLCGYQRMAAYSCICVRLHIARYEWHVPVAEPYVCLLMCVCVCLSVFESLLDISLVGSPMNLHCVHGYGPLLRVGGVGTGKASQVVFLPMAPSCSWRSSSFRDSVAE